jgi:hypothetical protein
MQTRLVVNALKTYGQAICLEAYRLSRDDGEGSNAIGSYLGLTTNQAGAAVRAGEVVARGELLFTKPECELLDSVYLIKHLNQAIERRAEYREVRLMEISEQYNYRIATIREELTKRGLRG